MTEPTTARLAQAQAGDGEAFRELVAPYRSELLTHCYRILGSFHDAEDVLQEVLLAAWGALDRFDGRALRAWLYRITTNRCLNHLRGRSRRPVPAGLPGLPGLPGAYEGPAGQPAAGEPWWLEPYPDVLLAEPVPGPEARYDARESIALSFVAGLQHLPPQQRVVLILRDVLGFPAAETADLLDTTSTAVNSALIRARAGLRPERDPHDVPLPKSPAEAAVVDRFVDALERFDVEQLVSVLTSDARFSMPPEPAEFHGPDAIVGFLRQLPFWGGEIRTVPTRANNQEAVVYYLADPVAPIWRAGSILVFTVRGDRISGLTRFGDRGLLSRFGLPRTMPRE